MVTLVLLKQILAWSVFPTKKKTKRKKEENQKELLSCQLSCQPVVFELLRLFVFVPMVYIQLVWTNTVGRSDKGDAWWLLNWI